MGREVSLGLYFSEGFPNERADSEGAETMNYDPLSGLRNWQPPDYSEDFEKVRRAMDERAGRFDAGAVYDHLIKRIKEFEALLPSDKELGLKLANFGIAESIHIRNISYKDPNLIEFLGVDENGETVFLVQHISQLNFLLAQVSPPKEEEPYRIGFRLK